MSYVENKAKILSLQAVTLRWLRRQKCTGQRLPLRHSRWDTAPRSLHVHVGPKVRLLCCWALRARSLHEHFYFCFLVSNQTDFSHASRDVCQRVKLNYKRKKIDITISFLYLTQELFPLFPSVGPIAKDTERLELMDKGPYMNSGWFHSYPAHPIRISDNPPGRKVLP